MIVYPLGRILSVILRITTVLVRNIYLFGPQNCDMILQKKKGFFYIKDIVLGSFILFICYLFSSFFVYVYHTTVSTVTTVNIHRNEGSVGLGFTQEMNDFIRKGGPHHRFRTLGS